VRLRSNELLTALTGVDNHSEISQNCFSSVLICVSYSNGYHLSMASGDVRCPTPTVYGRRQVRGVISFTFQTFSGAYQNFTTQGAFGERVHYGTSPDFLKSDRNR